ncbi:MAG TPA: pitrilysin family protein, partial [Solirubrobacterales bacterium]|nr:pitrilysin family protein [Solirubrobacterales bacterium]
MSGAKLTQLDSGVRVVTEEVPSVRSVALGLWVRTGSRNETPAQAGVSHFLEHLLFKGTARYSAIEISERFDGLGASVNAATGKETTHLHARFLDEHTEEVFDLLAEMLLAPTYPDIDSERQVVLEEIAMYDDEPQDRVHDVLAEAVFGAHPLGRRVLGEPEVIASIPVPDIEAYRSDRYAAPQIVVGAAGHLGHERIVELAEQLVRPPAEGGGAAPEAPIDQSSRLCFLQKETEQYHICFGGPGISRGDDRRFALGVLDAIFGGSTSSRLFREIREKRGLAYAVGSYTQQFVDGGLIGLYVGTREENI